MDTSRPSTPSPTLGVFGLPGGIGTQLDTAMELSPVSVRPRPRAISQDAANALSMLGGTAVTRDNQESAAATTAPAAFTSYSLVSRAHHTPPQHKKGPTRLFNPFWTLGSVRARAIAPCKRPMEHLVERHMSRRYNVRSLFAGCANRIACMPRGQSAGTGLNTRIPITHRRPFSRVQYGPRVLNRSPHPLIVDARTGAAI